MRKDLKIYDMLVYLAIFGDISYILFLLYNGIDEGFKDIFSVQLLAPIGMIVLLVLNIILLFNLKNIKK